MRALVVVAVLGGVAHAQRPPAAQTIEFRAGSTQDVIVGTTFGLLTSHDAGVTWRWYCNAAIGFGGTFDPDYAYTSSGSIFATTFYGLKVSRDACTFGATTLGSVFTSTVETVGVGVLHVGAADPNDAKIYTSADDGATFPLSAAPGMNNDWWESLKVAPSDSQRLYLSGYRFVKTCSASSSNSGTTCSVDLDCPGGTCVPGRVFLLDTSTNGGASFTPMVTTGITTSTNSAIDIVGIDPATPTTVYARANLENGGSGDGLYRSDDAGASWTKILTTNDPLGVSFVARHDGDLVAATMSSGSQVSHDRGATWTPLACAPRIHCLYQAPNNDLWACTNNFDEVGQPADGFALMKTADLVTWTGVLNLQAVAGPVDCADGTVQHDTCAPMWPALAAQLGSGDATAVSTCPVVADDAIAEPPDAGNSSVPPDAGDTIMPPAHGGGGGCCSGSGGRGSLVLAGLVILIATIRSSRRSR